MVIGHVCLICLVLADPRAHRLRRHHAPPVGGFTGPAAPAAARHDHRRCPFRPPPPTETALASRNLSMKKQKSILLGLLGPVPDLPGSGSCWRPTSRSAANCRTIDDVTHDQTPAAFSGWAEQGRAVYAAKRLRVLPQPAGALPHGRARTSTGNGARAPHRRPRLSPGPRRLPGRLAHRAGPLQRRRAPRQGRLALPAHVRAADRVARHELPRRCASSSTSTRSPGSLPWRP